LTMAEVTLESTITCPTCEARSEETMPTDACVFFFDCRACSAHLRPRAGDCCVFCSFAARHAHRFSYKNGAAVND
jgi:hypothetical protein